MSRRFTNRGSNRLALAFLIVLALGLAWGAMSARAASERGTAADQPSSASETTSAPGYTVAILPFAASGPDLADMAVEVPQLMTAYLSAEPAVILVERAQLEDALSEIELGQSGTVDPATAAKIGYLTGAQILITGRAFPVQRDIVVVAKIVSVETSRVYGETVTFPARGSVVEASQELSRAVGATIAERGARLVAAVDRKPDVIDRLRPEVDGAALPTVSISIPELNLNRRIIDPAAETEIAHILQRLGFEIIDPLASNQQADVEITGEAISEFGLRKGNLVSSRARVEIKAVDRAAGKVILVSRADAVAVDISPEMAGKAAIAKAAAELTEQLVPLMVGNAAQ